MSIRNRITQYLSSVLSTRISCTKGGILLGRKTTGAGYAEEITIGTGLELTTGKVLNATAVGATNLTATASPTAVVVASDTGTDATIAAASESNAGLLLPAEKTAIAGIPALTYAGADPNIPETISVTGAGTASINSDYTHDETHNGYFRYLRGGDDVAVYWSTLYSGWVIGSLSVELAGATYVGDSASSPELVAAWVPDSGISPGPTVTGDTLIATHHGQWCKASTAWWQWNETIWIPRFTLAGKHITRNDADDAYFSLGVDNIGLPTTTPFP